MIEISREIDAPCDFELGRPRERPLTYDISWPQEGEAAGVVLVIPGFGVDTNEDYARSLRRHVVESTGMGAVSARYHAIQARPGNGGALSVEPRDHLSLIGLAVVHGLKIDDLGDLSKLAEGLAAAGQNARTRAWLEPGGGELQNFGVLQALDHLAVIGDLIENAPAFDTRRIVALGSSHGGYIAHLIAKFAPSTLAAIIDNSSYVQPPMAYLGMGKGAEFIVAHEGVILETQTRSAWSIDNRALPNFYGRDQDLIRDARYPPHVAAMRGAATDHGTQYFMVNAARDEISPPHAKRRQAAVLGRAGFEADLAVIGPDEIDGQLFKVLAHGLDCSLKRLFDRYIGRVRGREVDPDAVQGSAMDFPCVDRGYRIAHTAVAPYVTAEVYDLYPDSAEDAAQAAA